MSPISYADENTVLLAAKYHGYASVSQTVHHQFNNLLFQLARAAIDVAVLASGSKTIHPKDFHTAKRIHDVFEMSLSQSVMQQRSRRRIVGKQLGGGTYMAPEFFSHTSTTSPNGGFGTSAHADAAPSDAIRYPLISDFDHTGGGAAAFKHNWTISSTALSAIVRDYNSQRNVDIRLNSGAIIFLGSFLVRNMNGIISSIKKSPSRSPPLAASQLSRAASSWKIAM